MINFLPPEATSAIKREYITRTVSVWALLLAAVTLVEAAFLLPTYLLLSRQLDALAIEVVSMESDASASAYETMRAALAQAQALALQLGVAQTGPAASEVLRETQKARTTMISISGFSYEYMSATEKTVEIRGVAATREALAGFSAALERSPLFARAEVPVSDLAKDRDLPFTLTVTLANGAL